jgi:competence protein ComEC
MKRPLCYLAIIITAIVYIYLYFFSSEILNGNTDKQDGDFTEIVGQVSDKGWRLDYFGEPSPVVYIIPNDIRNNKYKYVQCYMSSEDYQEPSIGETVRICGTVKTFSPNSNPGEFDSRLYYSTLKISYRIKNARITGQNGKKSIYRETLYQIRTHLERALDKCLDEEDAAVMKAVLLGDKNYLKDEIKEQYKLNGIFHLLVVSGTHFSLIGLGIYNLLRRCRLSNLWSMAVSVVFMYSYGSMCGMGSSAFRAILMFSFRILAPVVGRTYDVLSALALAEVFLLMDQPLYLYSSGFLFSFGAVLGITVLSPCLGLSFLQVNDGKMKFAGEDKEKNKKLLFRIGSIVRNGTVTGVSIALMTLPVYGLFYYTYPVHSLVLNLLVIPLMGLLMTSGIICIICGLVLVPMGKIIGVFIHLILTFYKLLSSSGDVVRSFTLYMGHSEPAQVVAYLVLLIAFVVVSRHFLGSGLKGNNRYYLLRHDVFRFGIIIVGIIILTFHSSHGLEMDFIDVGQGDGIVISCDGKHMLIDGGSTSKKNVGKYQIIPVLKYKGIGTLDAVVLTHEDEDHISGIFELMDDMEKGGINIKQLMLPEVAEGSRGDKYHKLEKRATELRIPIAYINTGEAFCLGNAKFTCLNPQLNMVTEGANAYSTVLYMRYDQFTALFTGDMEEEGLENVKKELRDFSGKSSELTLLKVAHHGSMYTTDNEFLELTRPKVAIISCGIDNSYGHPHQELLDRLAVFNARVYRTDQSGYIQVVENGNKMTISQFICNY